MTGTTQITPPASHRRYLALLGGLYLIVTIAFGVDPYDRDAWILEHFMVVVGLLLLLFSYRYFPLSRVSYTLIFVFLCFHEVGTQYTYSRVPYDSWFERIFGRPLNPALGLERNHYDRVVHFLYGLLLAWPLREIFLHAVRRNPPPFWSYLLPLSLIIATSVIYEFAEWGAVIVFGGDLGMAFLGTQGDEWDAHQDTLCAVSGALIATGVMILIHLGSGRDFPAEWAKKHTRTKEPET